MSAGSITGVDREDQLVAGEIKVVNNLTHREKKALTKRLLKTETQFREHMIEVVKDFPTMRAEVGGGNFDKTIRNTLFNQMENSRASFDSKEDAKSEEIVGQFQKFLKSKCGPPDMALPGKDAVIPKAIATPENTQNTVAEMVAKKFKMAVGDKANELENEDGTLKLPTQGEVAKAPTQVIGNKHTYISSKILNAYKAVKEAEVKMIQNKAEKYEREFIQKN